MVLQGFLAMLRTAFIATRQRCNIAASSIPSAALYILAVTDVRLASSPALFLIAYYKY